MSDKRGKKTVGEDQSDARGNKPDQIDAVRSSQQVSPAPENGTEVRMTVSDLTRDTYEIDTERFPHKGKVLIFNNINFNNGMPDRVGSDQDASTMYQRFCDLGFEPTLFNDCTHDDIMEKLKGVASEDHGSYSCFACVVLSHGDQDGIWATDKSPVLKTEHLMATVNAQNCKSLIGKPKLFIIQACRGLQSDQGVIVDVNDRVLSDAAGETEEYLAHLTQQENMYQNVRLPTDMDFLLVQATSPGKTSIRNTQTGSPFIQCLSEVMSNMEETDEFLDVLTKVNRKMAFNFSNGHGERSRISVTQMPCFTSMLTKKLLLKKGC
ncbi:caspase-3-like [Mizuhopecten yessoensis]|uniref:Caspase-3 n=1 Tax=Mizuhopecten yessoensis TaxID=6573 RepID=A0A210QYD8_MIZYE|nr:caspase-3-like [Mizuhopecten yessoensis]OWF53783.1 Caspase-3 [Mizuhopecten yessoensis]